MATRLPGRRRRTLALLLLFCSGISAAIASDPAEFTYRSSPSEVRLNFSAMDQNNHGVATLQASDFAVVDKDVIVRNFQSFTRADWTKLEIAILIDASESVRPHFGRETSDLAQLVSQATGIPEENLSIFSFKNSQPDLLCAGDCRTSQAAERLPAQRARGQTPLFDTIVFAEDFLARHGDAQTGKVLIVFSDGMDTISRNFLKDAVDSALRNEVQVNCIDLSAASWSQGTAVLHRLANATGGRYFPADGGATQALNQVLEGFRASYTVTYRLPTRTSGFHTLRVLPTRNVNLQFHSRSGYYYPNQVQ